MDCEFGSCPAQDAVVLGEFADGVQGIFEGGDLYPGVVKATDHHLEAHVFTIISHDLKEFQAVENVNETLILAGIQTEAGIAFIGGKDGLAGVVGFHEQGGGLTGDR